MIKKFFLNEKIILVFIIINTVCLFIDGFQGYDNKHISYTDIIDNLITVVFIIEMLVKITTYRWKGYIASNWNKLDFFLVVISVPSIITIFFSQIPLENLSFLLIFRLLRILRFLRFFRFVSGIESLIAGSLRALKTSAVVMLVFFTILIVFSLLSNYFFYNVSPEHFGNPLQSMYSVFKIFTVEGWFDVPDDVASQFDGIMLVIVRIYFILILFTGGIIGLSLLNSIFVDAMVSDNNDDLERIVNNLHQEIKELKLLITNINKRE